jgi:hypothetical protein
MNRYVPLVVVLVGATGVGYLIAGLAGASLALGVAIAAPFAARALMRRSTRSTEKTRKSIEKDLPGLDLGRNDGNLAELAKRIVGDRLWMATSGRDSSADGTCERRGDERRGASGSSRSDQSGWSPL